MAKKNGFVIAFLVYLSIVPLIPENLISKIPITDLTVVLIIGSYGIYSLINRERRIKLYNNLLNFLKDKVILSMMLVLLIMVISTSYSQDKVMAIKETIRFSTYIAIMFFVIAEIDFKKDMKSIIKAIYYPAFLVSLFGIIQKFTGIGMDVNTNGYMRIESTLGHPNSLGVYLVLLIFPLIMIILGEKKSKEKLFYMLTAILMLINIMLCWSRNSWIALAFGLVLLAIFYNWKVLYAFLLGGVIAILVPSISTRLLEIGSKVFSDGRVKHWAVAIKMFIDNPIGGVGNGNYVTLHSEYVTKYPNLLVPGEENFPTHNSYLKVLSELGVLGFIPFMLMNVLVVIKGFFVYVNSKGKGKNIILGIFISILVFMQVNLLDNMWFVPKVTTIYWVMIAAIISVNNKIKVKIEGERD